MRCAPATRFRVTRPWSRRLKHRPSRSRRSGARGTVAHTVLPTLPARGPEVGGGRANQEQPTAALRVARGAVGRGGLRLSSCGCCVGNRVDRIQFHPQVPYGVVAIGSRAREEGETVPAGVGLQHQRVVVAARQAPLLPRCRTASAATRAARSVREESRSAAACARRATSFAQVPVARSSSPIRATSGSSSPRASSSLFRAAALMAPTALAGRQHSSSPARVAGFSAS